MFRLWLTTLLMCFLTFQPLTAFGQILSIGVLSQRSDNAYTDFWHATAKYLSNRIPEHTFIIKPLGIECLNHAISKQQLDFVITNPAHLVQLNKEWDAFSLASLESRYHRNLSTFYSAAIITKSDRPEIRALSDLKKIHFMAANPQEFGGYLMTWRALLEIGIDPHKDFFELYFSNHAEEQIVQAVLNNEVDAAVVQSGVLESLEAKGLLEKSQIKVLNSTPEENTTPLHSTPLYPEWQFVALASTDVALASQIAKLLKNMPKNEMRENYIPAYGWAKLQDLTLVHGLLRALKLPPYAPMPRISLKNLFEEHFLAISLALTLVVFLVGFSLWMRQVNRQLALSKNQLAAHRDNLKKEVSHRTLELHQLNKVLEQDIFARQKIEHTLRRSQRALQGFYQILVNPHLDEHQKLLHLMQLARRHFKMESVFYIN